MEYDEILQMCDKLLDHFTPEHTGGITHGGLNQYYSYRNSDSGSGLILSALKRLTEDKYLSPGGSDNQHYQITGTTFTFKNNGRYKWLVERENQKQQLKEVLEDLGLKSTQSVIDTNNSIQLLNQSIIDLNTDTKTYYTNQMVFNRTYRNLTWAIAISSGIYTLFAVLSYLNSCNVSKHDIPQLNTQKQSQQKLQLLDTLKPLQSVNISLKDSSKNIKFVPDKGNK